MEDRERLRQERDELIRRLEDKDREIKRLDRLSRLLQGQIDRSKIAYAAKDSLSRAIDAKRTELERYMNLLLGNCPDMILLFDKAGGIVYATASFLRACGLPSVGLIAGQSGDELFAAYAVAQPDGNTDRLFSRITAEGHSAEQPVQLQFKSMPEPRSYSVQVTPMLSEDGSAEGAMLILSDTTEMVRAQREAERANAAKSDFLATVSHEIRTPMNAIIGMADMLKSTGLDDRQHGYLRNIQDSSHVLLNLINDILDFSRIEAGRLETTPEYFKTDSLLNHLQSMFALMFEQKRLRFDCRFDPELPAVIYGDSKRVRQILTNLLNNALKYTKEGFVRFSARARQDGVLAFCVEDSGIGIRAEAMPRLFTAFERLDENRNHGIVGTGLGLAITHRLCELMGGSIEVTSAYGQGSAFTVLLPLPAGTRADLPSEVRKEAARFVAPDVRILVVDDIDVNLEITAFMLEPYEIKAEFAANGVQAVAMAEKTGYDMILMDHMMPEMDGVEATRRIRSREGKSQHVPIVALTANAVSGAMELFMENGFNDFLSKPIDAVALSACLLKWLPEAAIQRLE